MLGPHGRKKRCVHRSGNIVEMASLTRPYGLCMQQNIRQFPLNRMDPIPIPKFADTPEMADHFSTITMWLGMCCVVLCCVCVCVSVCVCVCVDSPALIALYAKSGHSLKDADIEDDQEQNMGLEGKSFKSFQVMSCHCYVFLKFAYVANVDALRRSMPGKSGLHYDNLDNLHAVVRGRKRWFVTCGAWCCCRPYPSPSDCCCQFQENS